MNKRLVIGLVLLAALLASCGSKQPVLSTNTAGPASAGPTETALPEPSKTPFPPSTDTPVPTPLPTPLPSPTATTPVDYGPDNFPSNVNPLTGLEVSDPSLLDRRPLGIKVNLYPRWQYRPPWGLNSADIVYEYYHNDGVSRLHAIFYGQDADLVGSVRSGRLLDDTLIRMFNSIFVYGGADPEIDQHFHSADYGSRVIIGGFDNPNCPPTAASPLCIFEPNGHHNLLVSTTLIREYAAAKNIDDSKQDLNGMNFAGLAPEGGTAATQMDVRYSFDMYSRWTYDPASGRYLHFRDTDSDMGGKNPQLEPLVDRNDNQQVGADNVIILIAEDDYVQRPPNEIVEINLRGSGTAYAFRDGQLYQVQWNHPSQDTMLYLTFPDGSPYPLKPGTTWFQVINPQSVITNEGTDWSFTYNIRP